MNYPTGEQVLLMVALAVFVLGGLVVGLVLPVYAIATGDEDALRTCACSLFVVMLIQVWNLLFPPRCALMCASRTSR